MKDPRTLPFYDDLEDCTYCGDKCSRVTGACYRCGFIQDATIALIHAEGIAQRDRLSALED